MKRWILWAIVVLTSINIWSLWNDAAVLGWVSALPAWIWLLMQEYKSGDDQP